MPKTTGEYQWPGRVQWHAHPATWYRFSRDRKAEQPAEHLKTYKGWIRADGCSGFNELYRSGHVHEVACMAHIGRKFVDVHASQGSAIDSTDDRTLSLYHERRALCAWALCLLHRRLQYRGYQGCQGPVAIHISPIEDWAEPEFGPD